MNIQLFSERCSGSTFLQAVISANLDSVNFKYEYGYKHWVKDEFVKCNRFREDFAYIVLIRSPYEWVRSIHRSPWHAAEHLKGLPFSEFIRSEWQCIWDEQAWIKDDDSRWMTEMDFESNPLNNRERFRNIIEVRNVKYQLWDERLQDLPFFFRSTHENFSKSPEQFVSRFAKALNIAPPGTFTLPQGYKGNMSWKKKTLSTISGGRLGGFKKKPRKSISLEDIDFLHEEFNQTQELVWGYDLEKLSEAERNYTLKTSKDGTGQL